MKRIFMLFAVVACCHTAFSQQNFKTVIKDKKTNQPLPGVSVTIADISKTSITNQYGFAIIYAVDTAVHTIAYKFIGYKLHTAHIKIPADTLTVLLEKEESELDEVVVSSTRSSRTITNIPTRIELIAGEELDEKGNMKPGDIRMLLSESTGIQTQQTSATSANSSIRIQGLDGRYTQILKDGFPLYSGAANGLGLLQIPPLDLKQVEVIKGSASTLYGGGAIAGLVNLISKTPEDKTNLNLQANLTSARGLDLNGFYSQKFGKAGLTLFASRNSNSAYDPANIDLTAIPKFERYTLNPRLFLYLNNKTELSFGINSSFENRTGGDIHYINGGGDNTHSYFEKNKTERLSTQLTFSRKISDYSKLYIKNSMSYFNRDITIPAYQFSGRQYGGYSEINYTHDKNKSEWITGLNLITDQFKERKPNPGVLRDYNQTVFGGFIQNNYTASKWLSLETGLRGDYIVDYGFAFLPRVSALFKINEKFSSRLSGGMGYKPPTIFTEESERIQYQNVLPVSSRDNKLERSYGTNLDVNYKTNFFNDQISFSVNEMLFYTNLNNPLSMNLLPGGQYQFKNISGHIDTKGMESNLKFGYENFKLFLGYTLTDAKVHENSIMISNPLTAKHRLNNVLMYEVDDKWKIGAEAYYFGKQKLNDGTTGKPFWTFGFMAEKLWERMSVYINFENFTDTRQTRFDNIYTGSISSPVFKDIYAPLDGFVINGGLKIRLVQ
jgi:outer membrane receptor for ferrienterochelin and colicins